MDRRSQSQNLTVLCFNFYTNQVLFHENTLKRASSLRHRQTVKDQKQDGRGSKR